jgi:glycosyltransferase 2 family protein
LRRLTGLLIAAVISVVSLRLLVTDDVSAALVTSLRRARWPLLLAALALSPFVQYLRARRFAVLIGGSVATPGLVLYRLASFLLLFNYLLPFRLGEASFPVMARRMLGVGLVRSSGILAVVRAVDLSIVVVVGSGVSLLVLEDGPIPRGVIGAALAGALLALAVMLTWGGITLKAGVVKGDRPGRVGTAVQSFFSGWAEIGRSGKRGRVLLLSGAIWTCQWTIGWLVLEAMLVGVSFGGAILSVCAVALAFALPINGVAGVGPTQAAWAWALSLTGVPWASGVSSGLVLNGVLVIGAVLSVVLAVVIPRMRDGKD